MNLLITGNMGFIGSCLTSVAIREAQEVIGLDDLSRGLNNVRLETSAKFIAHDCREGIAPILDELKEIAGRASVKYNLSLSKDYCPIDAVVHLAAGTGSLSRPFSELCELNIDMTKKIYHDAVEHGVKVFVFPTTSLVEGVPDAPYVQSKQQAMDWLLSQNDDINIIGLQFYNVTGAYNDFSEHRKLEVHIIPKMLEAYIRDETFIINGDDYDTVDGTPGRDYSNVVDVCYSILDLIDVQLSDHPFSVNKPIKLGTGEVTTTKQMIELFNAFMEPKFNKKLKWEVGPRRAFDCGSLKCDQPYLHILTSPTLIEESLTDELTALLKVVYGYDMPMGKTL